MNLLGGEINGVPGGVRSIINVGSFLKSVLDHADGNARARMEMGERPDLLEDLLKGANVHIPKLEELVSEFAGRTAAKTAIDFMLQTHSVLGLFNTLMDQVREDGSRGPSGPHAPSSSGPPRPNFRPASAAEQGSAPGSRQAAGAQSGPGQRSQHRADFTTAADPVAQRAAQQGTAVELEFSNTRPGEARPHHTEPPRRVTIGAFKMAVARHLVAFEEGVAAEQAELRRGIIAANCEAASLRADLRLLESERARWAASGAPDHAPVDDAASQPMASPADADESATADASSPAADTAAQGNDDDEIPEEEAAEIMNMILESQQRARDSLARDREMVEAMSGDLREIRQQVDRLRAPS